MSRPRLYGPPLLWALGAAAVLALIAFVFYSQDQRISHLEQDRVTLAEQLQEHGIRPRVQVPVRPGPSGPAGPSGPSGPAGPRGEMGRPPTQQEIAAAVSRYLREHPPSAGRPPTMTEISTAVAAYLREHPPSPGPTGPTGPPGRDGEDGRDGERGPPPTDEQVRAAVEQYLQANPLNCPSGWRHEELTVLATSGGTRTILTCVREDSPP